MAMDKDVLGAAIAAKITAPNAPPAMQTQILQLWTAISEEIINHIKLAEIEVSAGIPVTTPMGPGATSGTGQGVIKG